MTSQSTEHRICPVCEAGCGLVLTLEGEQVVRIRGNDADLFSEGHVCPKGIALGALHTDPRRLRKPRIRNANGLREVDWDEAFAEAGRRLAEIRSRHGNDAVAIYVGNPTAHNVGISMGLGVFAGIAGTRNFYSAASVDQMPKQLATELLFGNDMAVPIPDIVNTDCLLMLGANPAVSNGSLWMVPKFREKVRALHARGGSLICVDPRRTETARIADRHLAIRPGTDAWLLLALARLLDASGCRIPQRYQVRGADALLTRIRTVSVSTAAERCGIEVAAIESLAEQLRRAKSPVVYGRVGTTLQTFGTLTGFLIEVLNLMLGALDSSGGAVFGEHPFTAPTPPEKTGLEYARWHSRVSGRPEVGYQFPVSCLAEEIETPGPGQIRALVCFAGNPLLSNPDSERLRRALETLECIVAVDIFDAGTAALAHVLLPGTSPFEEGHYDHYLGPFGWKNVARYSPPVLPSTDRPDEWALCLSLGLSVREAGQPVSPQALAEFEDEIVAAAARRHTDDPLGSLHGRDVQEILGQIGPQRGVERLLDLGIRAGRYGDAFGQRDGLTLKAMSEAPDGIEFGPIRPRLTDVIRHSDGMINIAPEIIFDEITRLEATPPPQDLQLIGRRNIRTNNSWLHGVSGLDKGAPLCVIEMNDDDARIRGVVSGDRVRMFNGTGSIEAEVHVSDELRSGVVCFPHGFATANYNRLAPVSLVDEPSGTSALNGVEVQIERVGSLV